MLALARVDPDVPVERIVPTSAGEAELASVGRRRAAARAMTPFLAGRILRGVPTSARLRRTSAGRSLASTGR